MSYFQRCFGVGQPFGPAAVTARVLSAVQRGAENTQRVVTDLCVRAKPHVATVLSLMWRLTRTTFVALTGALKGAWNALHFWYSPFRWLYSGFMRSIMTRYDDGFDQAVRGQFRKFHIDEPTTKSENPHHYSAVIRHLSLVLIDKIITAIGAKPYHVQRGVGSNADGTSYLYDPIDLCPVQGKIEDNSVLVLSDVDHFLDMNYIGSFAKPILIYGVSPVSVPEQGPGHMTYIEQDQFSWVSHCGYVTKHKVWDYGADFLTTQYRGTAVIYKVRRYSMPMGRIVTALVPYASWSVPFGWMVKWFARAVPRYHKFTHRGQLHDWVAFRWINADGLTYVTISADGPDSCGITLAYGAFSQLLDSVRAFDQTKVPEHTVIKYAGQDRTLLCSYCPDYIKFHHKLDTLHRGAGFVVPVAGLNSKVCDCAHHNVTDRSANEDPHYKLGDHLSEKADKTTVTVVAPAVCAPGCPPATFVPVRDKPAAEVCQRERITKVQAEAVARLNPVVRAKFEQFVEHLMARLGTIPDPNPDWLDEVRPCYREKMRLANEQEYAEVAGEYDLRRPRGFIKAEAYQEPKDPRAITPLPAETQCRLYPFVQSLQKALHTQAWFAFGSHPKEVAARLRAMSHKALLDGDYCFETDFSRYDGTITPTMRELEKMIYTAAFPSYAAHLGKVHALTYNLTPTICGAKCDAGGARASGAADTCLMNSMLNLFVGFTAVGDAVFADGMVGGDDGLLFADRYMGDTLERCAAACGFKVKCVARKPGEPYTFLARAYAWDSENSVCDAKRTLSKAHIIPEPNMPPKFFKDRLVCKLQSLLLMDSNTPVVGDVLKQMLKIAQSNRIYRIPQKPAPQHELSWVEKWCAQSEYPNKFEPWMTSYIASKVRWLNSGRDAWPEVEYL